MEANTEAIFHNLYKMAATKVLSLEAVEMIKGIVKNIE